MRSGAILSLAEIETGCRGYIAFSGGVQVPAVMGSASTYSRGAYGGIQGRALKKGDRLELGEAPVAKPESLEHWHISESIVPQYSEKPTVRVVRGPQWDWFSEKAQQGFLSYTFTVSPDMDRMGVRLSGAALDVASSWEMHSEAVATGSVQIPRDGQPIVLMADRQTIGGYPKIANVITVDLPLLAQVRPGSKVRFAEVDLDTAQALLLAEENALAKLRAGLAEKFRR
jgi:antagonist of KipI